MYDIVGAILGYLVGLESTKSKVRCHTLAIVGAFLFFLASIIVYIEPGSLDWGNVGFLILFSVGMYVLIFFILKVLSHKKPD